MSPAAGMFPVFPPPPFCYVPRAAPPYFHHAPMSPVWPSPAVPARSVWANTYHAESDSHRSAARRARSDAVNGPAPGVVHHAGVHDHNTLTAGSATPSSRPTWTVSAAPGPTRTTKSLAYLARRGLNVGALRDHGVRADMLCATLFESGLISPRREPPRNWITYAGAYHVAYLVKIVTRGAALPEDVAGFDDAVRRYLGNQVYDVAWMAGDCPAMPLGLERIAAHLGFHLPLWSPQLAAAAGVRALQVFMHLKYGEFGGNVQMYRGLLEGLH
ncbi:hypothetical protein ZWY2020_053386 [Hordeum vulgare]|nr:hypothetical protein ZWY2020_053386 [Hordeum vulgare]